MSSQRDKGTIRYGMQALYTFTPFKLIRAQHDQGYTIILAETFHHEVEKPPSKGRQNLLKWHSTSLKDEFPYNQLIERGKKKIIIKKTIIQPYLLFAKSFNKINNDKYIFRAHGKYGHWRYFPEYMEFSLEALQNGYYCRFGWVLLSSETKCPITKDCPLYRPDNKGNCKYYRGPMAYSSLYNVVPIIGKKYEPPIDKTENEPLIALGSENGPLLTITYISSGSYLMFIDGVQFRSKRAELSKQPYLYLKKNPGFRVPRAPAIQFEFCVDTLKELLKNVLSNNPSLARWITLKQRLYLKSEDNPIIVEEGRGFYAFDQLDGIVKNPSAKQDLLKAINHPKINDDLIDFASVLFVHSFAHLFLNWVGARYGYGKGDFSYYLEHDNVYSSWLKTKGIRVFVFEAAVGGLGYLRSFAEDLRKNAREVLNEFFGSIGGNTKGILAILDFCEQKSNEKLNNLPRILDEFKNIKGADKLIKDILEAYSSLCPNLSSSPYLNGWPPNLYPHVNSIREKIAEEVPPDLRHLIDDMLSKGPHCWDGCQLCVMLERGCSYSPFDQPFLVSRKLTSEMLMILKDMVNSPKQTFHLRREGLKGLSIYDLFKRFVSIASLRIDLVSPWLSPEVVQTIKEKVLSSGVNVRIITTNDINNKAHAESLEFLKELSGKIEIRILQSLHAKGMLVDNTMLLTGSFNFTIAGLKFNIENLEISFDLKDATQFKRSFDDLWEESQPLG